MPTPSSARGTSLCSGPPTDSLRYQRQNQVRPDTLRRRRPTAGAEAVEPDDTAEGAAEWATAEPEEDDEYMQYVDWDRFEAEQGEAVEQGGGEQGGEE